MLNILNIALTIKKKLAYKFYKFKLRGILKSRSKDWIFGRVACMGQDVLSLLGYKEFLYNTQKGRVDYLLDLFVKDNYNAKTNHILKYIKRKDLHSLIQQQEFFSWNQLGLPKLIYLDSYSELTDQLFINKREHWGFCSNYSDVHISDEFDNSFEGKGLLPINEIEENYCRFFEFLTKKFPNTPIVFLHFPVKLDNRLKFKDRYNCILNSIEKLETQFVNLHSIKINDEIVDWPEVKISGIENFPYHYNQATYFEFVNKIKELKLFDSNY
jgi:hypothetical protein